MNASSILALAIVVVLGAYLLVAILLPEKFS